jgi:hypothetical protein
VEYREIGLRVPAGDRRERGLPVGGQHLGRMPWAGCGNDVVVGKDVAAGPDDLAWPAQTYKNAGIASRTAPDRGSRVGSLGRPAAAGTRDSTRATTAAGQRPVAA